MVEAKHGKTLGLQLNSNKEERFRLEKVFKKYPKTIKLETQELSTLSKCTSAKLYDNFSDRLYKTYKFAVDKIRKGGFDELVLDSDERVKTNVYIPFNKFVISEKYLENLNDLLSSALPSYPDEFAANGFKLIIEQQALLKKGYLFNIVNKTYEKKEEILNIYDDQNKKMLEIENIMNQSQINFKSAESIIKQLAIKEKEIDILGEKAKKAKNEKANLVRSQQILSRVKFIEKIKKDPERNVIDEIATVNTLIDVFELGVINGTQIEEKIIDEYLKDLYPNPILNNKTRKDIGMAQKEIRKKLKESY